MAFFQEFGTSSVFQITSSIFWNSGSDSSMGSSENTTADGNTPRIRILRNYEQTRDTHPYVLNAQTTLFIYRTNNEYYVQNIIYSNDSVLAKITGSSSTIGCRFCLVVKLKRTRKAVNNLKVSILEYITSRKAQIARITLQPLCTLQSATPNSVCYCKVDKLDEKECAFVVPV